MHDAGDRMIEQRVAVGIGAYDRVGCNRAAAAALIDDDDRLAQFLGDLVGGDARGDVDTAAGRKRHVHLDRARREIRLGTRRRRENASDADHPQRDKALHQFPHGFHILRWGSAHGRQPRALLVTATIAGASAQASRSGGWLACCSAECHSYCVAIFRVRLQSAANKTG